MRSNGPWVLKRLSLCLEADAYIGPSYVPSFDVWGGLHSLSAAIGHEGALRMWHAFFGYSPPLAGALGFLCRS